MKNLNKPVLSLTASIVELMYNDGVKYIEVTDDLLVCAWYSDCFFDKNKLLPQPFYDCGLYHFPAGAVYEIPQFNPDNCISSGNGDF